MTKPETGVYTAVTLYDKIIPPMKWIAKDFLGEGVTMLSARPKAGKSLLALQMGIAVATGEPFLARYETVKGAVLYINVDDPSQSRLQNNLHLLGGRVDGLSFMSELPELDNGGLEILDLELARMATIDPCRLLILDTLTALRKEQSGKNLVKADYEFIAGIKRLASKHGCSVWLISHSRKDSTSSEKVDGIDSHLGTTGLTAAVDAVMLLTGADDTRKILKAKGRDISPFEVHMELQVEDRSGWLVVDAPAEKKKELGALRQRILDAVLAIGPCGPDAISKMTGDNPSTIRVYLPRMVKAGQLWRNATGCYSAEEHTPSVTGVAPVTPVAANYEDPTTVTPATPVTPNTPPTQPVAPIEPILFKTRKGKIWKIGQDVECLQHELKVTQGEAESLLTYGQNAGQILAIVQNSWKSYSKANSRVDHLRDILSGGKKTNNPAPTAELSIIDRLRAVIDSTPRGFNDIAKLASVSTRESSDSLDELLERGEVYREEIDGLAYFSTASPAIPQNEGMEESQWLN